MKKKNTLCKVTAFALSMVMAAGVCTTATPVKASGVTTKTLSSTKSVTKLCYVVKDKEANSFAFFTKKTKIKGCTITKVKSSKASVLKVAKNNLGTYPMVEATVKKAGSAKVTVTAKKGAKTIKQTFKFKTIKYTNPFKTLKVGKKSLKSKFKKTINPSLTATVGTAKKIKLSVKTTKTYQIKSATYYSLKNNKLTAKKIKANKSYTRVSGATTEYIAFKLAGKGANSGMLFGFPVVSIVLK